MNGAICSISLSTSPCAGDHREAGNVVDRLFRIELGALAARPVENVDQMALQVEQAELEHGEQADRPRADDDDVRLDGRSWLRIMRSRSIMQRSCAKSQYSAAAHAKTRSRYRRTSA